jgi:hypothetical protein
MTRPTKTTSVVQSELRAGCAIVARLAVSDFRVVHGRPEYADGAFRLAFWGRAGISSDYMVRAFGEQRRKEFLGKGIRDSLGRRKCLTTCSMSLLENVIPKPTSFGWGITSSQRVTAQGP